MVPRSPDDRQRPLLSAVGATERVRGAHAVTLEGRSSFTGEVSSVEGLCSFAPGIITGNL